MDTEHKGPASRVLAQGPDWGVWDVVCTLGPRDRPFEEQHEFMSIAAVLGGTFQYRSSSGTELLYPGSFLLGNAGACFECGHEHGTGDRCVAFGFAPSLFEEIAASAAGRARFRFKHPMLPSVAGMAPVLVDIETRAITGKRGATEEFVIALAEQVVRAVSGFKAPARAPSARDQRRISDVLRFIDEHYSDELDLKRLATIARMSKYHFLRTFRRTVGSTPHQYLLDLRLRRCAVEVRIRNDSVGRVAAEAGFGDLSTFYQRFRKVFGVSPHVLRAGRPL
jgi:AraC family transcriptional regulator